MAEAFDPYHKWLGIPPHEQPPDHYRLLAVSRFETDLDVIANAADQRMAHVRTFQTGRHASLSQRLLNEIAAARVCLLSAERKAQYDEQLRLERPIGPPPIPPPVAEPPPSDSPVLVRDDFNFALDVTPIRPVRARRQPIPWAWMAGGTALLLILTAWALQPAGPPASVQPPPGPPVKPQDTPPPAVAPIAKAPEAAPATPPPITAPIAKAPEAAPVVPSVTAPATPPEQPPPEAIVRGPVPPAGSLQVAEADLAVALGSRSAEELLRLSREPGPAARRYVMLERARQLALQDSNAPLFLSVLETFNEQFEIDLPRLKTEGLLSLLPPPPQRPQREMIEQLLDASSQIKDSVLARRAAEQALAAARRLDDKELIRRATLRLVGS